MVKERGSPLLLFGPSATYLVLHHVVKSVDAKMGQCTFVFGQGFALYLARGAHYTPLDQLVCLEGNSSLYALR